MDNKGKSKVVHEDQQVYDLRSNTSEGKGREVWDDDAAAAALGGWIDPGRRRDRSLFAGVLPEQVINSPCQLSLVYHDSYLRIYILDANI
jgi:hypothetical protein